MVSFKAASLLVCLFAYCGNINAQPKAGHETKNIPTARQMKGRARQWIKENPKGIVDQIRERKVGYGFKNDGYGPESDNQLFDYTSKDGQTWFQLIFMDGPIAKNMTIEELTEMKPSFAADNIRIPGFEYDPHWAVNALTPTSAFEDGVEITYFNGRRIKMSINTTVFMINGYKRGVPIPADGPAPRESYFYLREELPLKLLVDVPIFFQKPVIAPPLAPSWPVAPAPGDPKVKPPVIFDAPQDGPYPPPIGGDPKAPSSTVMRRRAEWWVKQNPKGVVLKIKEDSNSNSSFVKVSQPTVNRLFGFVSEDGMTSVNLIVHAKDKAMVQKDWTAKRLMQETISVAINKVPLKGYKYHSSWDVQPQTSISSFSEGVKILKFDGERIRLQVKTDFSGIGGIRSDMDFAADAGISDKYLFGVDEKIPLFLDMDVPIEIEDDVPQPPGARIPQNQNQNKPAQEFKE